MDSYVSSASNPAATGPPSPQSACLQAHRPLLVVRMADGRMYIYRADTRPMASLSGTLVNSSTLVLKRLPFDWLKCAALPRMPPVWLMSDAAIATVLALQHSWLEFLNGGRSVSERMHALCRAALLESVLITCNESLRVGQLFGDCT